MTVEFLLITDVDNDGIKM